MDLLRSILLVLVWACSISTAVGRVLQERPSIVKELPVQIGDGSERVLTKSYISARGGAVKALGRSVLVDLRKTARLRGTVRDLARLIDTDEDLVRCLPECACYWLISIVVVVQPHYDLTAEP